MEVAIRARVQPMQPSWRPTDPPASSALREARDSGIELGRGRRLGTSAAPAWAIAGLLSLGFALWLGLSWSGYAQRYTPAGWRKGDTQLVEITLVRQDKQNLSCASNVVVDGLHCGFHGNQRPFEPRNEREILSPYVTVKGELLLAAGLWSATGLRGWLPSSRFTVVCNYHVRGVMRSGALRWSPTGKFDPLKQSAAVGSLTDCAVPE